MKTAKSKFYFQRKFHAGLAYLRWIFNFSRDGYLKFSYSQEGEDRVLNSLLGGIKDGFYIDVGAHHPKRFSNTYLLYLQGWHGINIDAMPGSMMAFKKFRPRDINLELAISNQEQELTYYEFDEPALNSFDFNLVSRYVREGNPIVNQTKIYTTTLSQVLDTYLPENRTIQVLSIDVEGLDFEVLNSNNWDKYRPSFVLVEDSTATNYKQIEESSIRKFMLDKKYDLSCKTMHTLFFFDTLVHNGS